MGSDLDSLLRLAVVDLEPPWDVDAAKLAAAIDAECTERDLALTGHNRRHIMVTSIRELGLDEMLTNHPAIVDYLDTLQLR
jgi:hypothetical protein